MGSETLLTCNLHGGFFAVLSGNITATFLGSKNDHPTLHFCFAVSDLQHKLQHARV